MKIFFLFLVLFGLANVFCSELDQVEDSADNSVSARLNSLARCEVQAESILLQMKELESSFGKEQSMLLPLKTELTEILRERKNLLRGFFQEKLDSNFSLHSTEQNEELLSIDDSFIWDAVRMSIKLHDHATITTWFDLGGTISQMMAVEICMSASIPVLQKLFENSAFLDLLYELDIQSPVLENSYRLWRLDDVVLIKLLMEAGFSYPAPVNGRSLLHRLTAPIVNGVIIVDDRSEERYAAIKASIYRAKITGSDILADEPDYMTGLTPLQNILEFFPGEMRSFEELLFNSSDLDQLKAYSLAIKRGRGEVFASLLEFGCEYVKSLIANEPGMVPIAAARCQKNTRQANLLRNSNRGKK